MAQQIPTSFVRQYESEVHHLFQRQGGILKFTVRMKEGIVGKSTTFQKIGKGAASSKARHGVITPMNQDHTAIECLLEDFYAGDWVDRLDEAKVVHDERMAIALGGAWALGRKVDDQIFTSMDATTQSTQTITITNSETIENSTLDWVGALDDNDVPNDGRRYAAVSPKMWRFLMKIDEYADADFVGPNGLPFTEGAPILRFKNWLGVLWTVHTGVPGKGTATSKQFAWHQSAVGYAAAAIAGDSENGSPVDADITWHGDRASWFVNHMMSGGSCLIDDTGVIEANVNDTGSLPTS